MQETTYKDRDGQIQKMLETFNLPNEAEAAQSVLNERYQAALKKVFAAGGNLVEIKQRRIGRNDPCPCGSGRKFKKCCEQKMDFAMRGIDK